MAEVQLRGQSNRTPTGVESPADVLTRSLDWTERASYPIVTGAAARQEVPDMRPTRRSTSQPPRIRPTTSRRIPLRLEVVERHVFTITDRTLATDMRQALRADDLERLDELIAHVRDVADVTATCDVLEVAEVKR